MKGRLAWVVFITGLVGCSGSRAHLARLAAQGSIDESAAVKAVAEININASPTKVFGLLAGISHWPTWQPEIAKTAIQGDATAGRQFVWSSKDGMDIHSTLQRVVPDQGICWTGRMLHIHAIHCWELKLLPDGHTVVKTRESMDGLFISRFYSSQELLDSDQLWLTRLKQAAETGTVGERVSCRAYTARRTDDKRVFALDRHA
jgi:uncharacterized protein YndB with AHSA1/START domain